MSGKNDKSRVNRAFPSRQSNVPGSATRTAKRPVTSEHTSKRTSHSGSGRQLAEGDNRQSSSPHRGGKGHHHPSSHSPTASHKTSSHGDVRTAKAQSRGTDSYKHSDQVYVKKVANLSQRTSQRYPPHHNRAHVKPKNSSNSKVVSQENGSNDGKVSESDHMKQPSKRTSSPNADNVGPSKGQPQEKVQSKETSEDSKASSLSEDGSQSSLSALPKKTEVLGDSFSKEETSDVNIINELPEERDENEEKGEKVTQETISRKKPELMYTMDFLVSRRFVPESTTLPDDIKDILIEFGILKCVEADKIGSVKDNADVKVAKVALTPQRKTFERGCSWRNKGNSEAFEEGENDSTAPSSAILREEEMFGFVGEEQEQEYDSYTEGYRYGKERAVFARGPVPQLSYTRTGSGGGEREKKGPKKIDHIPLKDRENASLGLNYATSSPRSTRDTGMSSRDLPDDEPEWMTFEPNAVGENFEFGKCDAIEQMRNELKAKEGKSNITAKVKDDKTQETTSEELTSSKTEPVVLPATNIAEFDGRPLLKDLDEVDVAVMNGNVDKADLDLTDEDLVKILGFEIDEEEGVEDEHKQQGSSQSSSLSNSWKNNKKTISDTGEGGSLGKKDPTALLKEVLKIEISSPTDSVSGPPLNSEFSSTVVPVSHSTVSSTAVPVPHSGASSTAVPVHSMTQHHSHPPEPTGMKMMTLEEIEGHSQTSPQQEPCEGQEVISSLMSGLFQSGRGGTHQESRQLVNDTYSHNPLQVNTGPSSVSMPTVGPPMFHQRTKMDDHYIHPVQNMLGFPVGVPGNIPTASRMGYGGGVHTQNGHVLVQHDLEAMHREKMLAAQNHTRQDMGHHRSYPNRVEQHRHHYMPPQPPPPQMASRPAYHGLMPTSVMRRMATHKQHQSHSVTEVGDTHNWQTVASLANAARLEQALTDKATKTHETLSGMLSFANTHSPSMDLQSQYLYYSSGTQRGPRDYQ